MLVHNQERDKEWSNLVKQPVVSAFRGAPSINCHPTSNFKFISLFTENRPDDLLAVIIKNTVFQSVKRCSGVTNEQHISTLKIKIEATNSTGNLVTWY